MQLSSGETESACETLNHGLSLYRELNQKVLQGVVEMLYLFGPCQLVVSSAFNPADAKPWANQDVSRTDNRTSTRSGTGRDMEIGTCFFPADCER